MPRRSNEFQRLGYLLHRQLHDRVTVTESAMVADRVGGEPQEVDVLIEEPVGQIRMLIGVECRDHNRRATVEWVQQMHGKHLHRTDKLILISRSGFTGSALAEAQRFGIETMSLQEAGEVDLAVIVGKLKEAFLGRFHFNISKGYAVFAEEYGRLDEPEISSDVLLCAMDDEIVGPVGEISREFLRQPDQAKELMELFYANQDRTRAIATFEVVPGSYLIDTSGTKWRVRAIKVEIECNLRVTPIPLRHGLLGAAHVSWGTTTDRDEQLFMVSTEQQGQPGRTTLRVAQGTEQTEQLIDMALEMRP